MNLLFLLVLEESTRCNITEPTHTFGLQPICWSGNEESETRRIFHVAIDRTLYATMTMEASVIDLICTITPTSDGMGLEMHELLFRQLKTVQEDLRSMQEQFRELILEEDKHQPRSSKLPRSSERYLYAQHVRSAETCEQAMSKYYSCHRNFQFGACFAVLRSQVKDLVNWALRSNDGLSYDSGEPDEHCDPMSKICQL